MSERKVLNKYYPPDFDPSKIPRMKLPKNRQYTVRLMAPFNMRCATCGEYIYKGKKFNARKEDVEGQDYLGIRIYRFYIKCTRCLQEISFRTDPKNTDYEIEAGATRNFMALKLAEEQVQREEDELKEEEATNPMKLLENRTKQSKHELEMLESLEELKDLNKRQRSINYDAMLKQFNTSEQAEMIRKSQEEEDEEYIKSVFGSKNKEILEIVVEKLEDNKTEKGEHSIPAPMKRNLDKESDVANNQMSNAPPSASKIPRNEEFVSTCEIKSTTSRTVSDIKPTAIRKNLQGLIRPKKQITQSNKSDSTSAPSSLSLLSTYDSNSGSSEEDPHD